MTLIVIFRQRSPEIAKPSVWGSAKTAKTSPCKIYYLSFIYPLYPHFIHCPCLHSFYIQYVSITHPLLLCFQENKSEIQEWALEDGMSLHHQARGRSRVRKHSAERPRVKGQVLVMDSPLKSLIRGDTAVWILAGLQHSSLVQNIKICVTVHVRQCACSCLYVCASIYCLHLPALAYMLFCISPWSSLCVCLIEGVYIRW